MKEYDLSAASTMPGEFTGSCAMRTLGTEREASSIRDRYRDGLAARRGRSLVRTLGVVLNELTLMQRARVALYKYDSSGRS